MAVAAFLCGCVTFTRTSTGDFDFEERFDKAAHEILEKSSAAETEALRGQRVSLEPKTVEFLQRHFLKANEIVLEHMLKVRKKFGVDRMSHAYFVDVYGRRRSKLLSFTMSLQPSLDVVESKQASATAFPSGKVLINRLLAEAFDINRDGFDSVLLGILIHELMHVRDGHALEQWATSDGRQAWIADKVIGAAASLTALIPFLSIKWDVEYPLSFGATKELPALSEFAADMGAVTLLDRAGFGSARYIAFILEASRTASRVAPNSALAAMLQQRTECLEIFSKTQFDRDLKGVVVGSKDAGDGLVLSFDLDKTYAAAEGLHAPKDLAKHDPGVAEKSVKDELSEIRAVLFIPCAIKRSFPKAKIEDGTLFTPSFDLVMFAQHL